MKKIFIVAGIASLAACSPATTEEPAAPAETTEVAAETTAADGGPSFGMFKVTQPDGKVSMEDVKADGTYTSTSEGEEPRSGTWEQKAPETFCSTSSEEGAVQKCYTEAVDEAGVWTSIDPDDGSVSTVERVES